MLSKVLIALYAAMPGSPNRTPQNRGATTPSAKFSAVEFDRRAGNAVCVQARRIAADDVRHGLPTLGEPLLQPGCDRRHMIVQTARRDQGAHGQRERQPAERRSRAQFLHGEGEDRAQTDHQQAGHEPAPRLVSGRRHQIQPARLEPGDHPTHRHDRMWEAAPEPTRVAEQGIDRHGKQQRAEQRLGVHQQHGRRPRPFASGAAPRGLLSRAAPATAKGHR